jgi:hypothetical protein
MDARRGEPDQPVARGDIGPWQHGVPLDGPDGEAGEVEIPAGVEAWHLGGLAADERRAGHAAALGDAGDDPSPGGGVELSRREIIEEEEGLGTLHDEIVDAHRDEVDADRVEDTRVDGDLEFRPDAVGRSDQNRVGVAGLGEIEEAAEAAELGIGARPARRLDQRLDRLDQCGAGVDVDAGLGVGHRPALLRLSRRHSRIRLSMCGIRNGKAGRIASRRNRSAKGRRRPPILAFAAGGATCSPPGRSKPGERRGQTP